MDGRVNSRRAGCPTLPRDRGHVQTSFLPLVLLAAAAPMDAAQAAPNCTTSGNIASLLCSATDIQMQGNAGASSLTVIDTTASSVAVLSNPSVTGPFVQSLTIDGTTTLNRADYPAVYMYSSQAGWNANLLIGSDVSLTSAGPFGAVWLRSESSDTASSNTIVVDSAATITSYGTNSDGITATSNNGPVSVTNRGAVTVSSGRGLYAEGGSASLTPVAVSITNLGSVHAYQAGVHALDHNGTATIDNQGSVRSTTRQGLMALSNNGGAQITNSGTVVADHYDAVVAAGTGGNVVVTNSGRIIANRNPNLVQVSPDFHAISAYTDGSGSVTVTNTASGILLADYDAGMAAASSNGAITLTNAGRIEALTGILADSNAGQVDILNEGVILATSTGISVTSASGGDIVNTGRISSSNTAFMVSNGIALTVDNRQGGVAVGSLQLGNQASFNNAGSLVLMQGVPLTNPAGTGSVVASTVGGNFAQTASGSMTIAVDSVSSYSTLTVGGAASLGGRLSLDVDAGYAGGTLTDVITAAGGVSDLGLSVTDNSLRYNFSALFGANGVDLVAYDTGMTTVREAVSRRMRGVVGAAAVWDSLLTGGTTSPELSLALQGILSSANADEVAGKVQQTVPLLAGDMMNVTYGTLDAVNAIIRARIDAADGLSRKDARDPERHLWIAPLFAHTHGNDADGAIGYGANTGGFVMGLDGKVTTETELGLALAYANTDVSSDPSGPEQSASSDTYQVLLYGRHALTADTGLQFQLDAGTADIEGRRRIDLVGLTVASSYDSYFAHAGIGLDHRFELSDRTIFKPAIRLDYSWMKDQAYSEGGAGGLDLNVDSRSDDALALGLTGVVSHQLTERLVATANAGVSYDVLKDANSITAAYAGAPQAPFTTTGRDPSAWRFNAGIGLDYSAASGFGVAGRYDAWHRDGSFGQTASLRLYQAF